MYAVLDAVATLRVAASVVAHKDMKASVKFLEQAEHLLDTGERGEGLGLPSEEESIRQWEQMVGGSVRDPEFREKVYRAAAELRKMDTEAAEQAAKNRTLSDLYINRNERRFKRRYR